MHSFTPRIVLVGVGRFGSEHLKEWQQLSADGEAALQGVVVQSEQSAARVRRLFPGPVHVGLQASILRDVDGVDLATPAATHYDLVKVCLEHAHVLVEKPLATDPHDAAELARHAKALDRHLVVGHVYRFHPLVEALREFLQQANATPRLITGQFINPHRAGVEMLEPRLEFLHPVDIIDALYSVPPDFTRTVRKGNVEQVSIRYPGPMNALLEVGWNGTTRRRELNFVFDDRRIDCDFLDQVIVVRKRDELHRHVLPGNPAPLRSELKAFARLLKGEHDARATHATLATRIVDASVRKVPPSRRKRPTAAVVGGGVFGATCAVELGRFCDVTLFERHAELMTEASILNQWRHHSGFHYPRSPQTIEEVIESREDFMGRYAAAVIKDFPSYYCTSAFAREITAERYLAMCRANHLNFETVDPAPDVLAPGTVSLCLKTDEGIVDVPLLKTIIERELGALPGVRVRRETEVLDAAFNADGSKRLTWRHGQGRVEEDFDFLVNATYANRNLLARWFRFPVRPLRFDLLELLVLELDIPRVSVTVLDGPFTSLTSMGRGNRFMLSHIHQSVIDSVVTRDGALPQWGSIESNARNLIRHGARYFPAVLDGRIVESRYGVRAVYAHSEDFDGRPTVVTDHGFGCWSVLGGKIITCVHNANEIATSIRNALDGD